MKEQLAGQMIDILNPGKVSKWKVRKFSELSQCCFFFTSWEKEQALNPCFFQEFCQRCAKMLKSKKKIDPGPDR